MNGEQFLDRLQAAPRHDYSDHPMRRQIRAQRLRLNPYVIILHETARRLGLRCSAYTRLLHRIDSEHSSRLFMQNTTASTAVTRLTQDKHLSKSILTAAGIRTPAGRRLYSAEAAAQAFASFGTPVVTKPVRAHSGHGASTSLTDSAQAYQGALRALEHGNEFLMETHVPGHDIRVLVVGGQAVGAFVRTPAQVRGDGESSVEALVSQRNRLRHRTGIDQPSIQLNEHTEVLLSRQGLSRSAVPPAGTLVTLTDVANISAGGDSIAMTEHLHPSYARLAVRATQAFAGMELAGVDMLVQDFRQPASDDNYVVLELNANPAFTGAMYPVWGEPVDIAEAWLRHCFRR